MKLSKITIVFLAVIAKIYSTGIVMRTTKSAESTELIVEAMTNILASCYGNEEFAIGLYGNLHETFIEALWSRKLFPIFLINNTDCADRPYFDRRKLHVFVIIATHWNQVLRGFSTINCSRFFNRRASFLIVDWTPTEKYGCYRVTDVFFISKVIRTFNVNILCLHRTKGITIFGYNPYTYQAPAPWQLTESFKYRNNDTLTVFEREYSQKGVCKNLDFEKANDLHGDPIEVNTSGVNVTWKYSPELIQSKSLKALVFIWEAMNIISSFVRRINGTEKTVIGKNSADILNDISMRRLVFENAKVTSLTYPLMQVDLVIMTNFEGYKSQLRKILTVVDFYSRCGTCLVLLVTLIFFKFFVHQALIPAVLNIVRIVCNTSFDNVPPNSASRIYLAGVLFFAVTMHGIFSGNLASYLTRDVPVEHAETIQDIIERNYTIYVINGFRHLFADPIYKGRVVLLDPYESLTCIEYLLRDPSGACVNAPHMHFHQSAEHNVHVSGNVIFTQYWCLQTEYDWPFEEKFNKVFLAMTEADIVDNIIMRYIRHRLSYVEPEDENPRVMTLTNLVFAFVILGIGLACATVCFIVEITIKPIRLTVAKVRRRLSNCFRRIKIRKLDDRK